VSIGDQIQKLEALLERVRRNKTSAPVRAAVASAAPAAAPLALDALPVAPAAPAAVAPPAMTPDEPFAAAPSTLGVSPPLPPVAPITPSPAAVESALPTRPMSEPPAPPVATPSWQPEPGSAVQPRPTEPPTELSDDDLLEVTTLPPEAEISGTVDVSAATGTRSAPPEAQEEEAPASSSRFKVPSTLDEALASAAESDVEGEREIPAQTPPPESGPQEALPATGLEAGRLPDVDQLEADLDGPPSLGPTAEQLGETIELEAPRGPELEIDVTVVSEAAVTVEAAEELEVTLPRASMPSGLYDVNVTAPPPEPVVTLEAPPQAPAAVTQPAPASDQPDRTHARPAVGATDVAQVSLVPQSAPRSFVELLDASLGL
jgi:hypothetical protein